MEFYDFFYSQNLHFLDSIFFSNRLKGNTLLKLTYFLMTNLGLIYIYKIMLEIPKIALKKSVRCKIS